MPVYASLSKSPRSRRASRDTLPKRVTATLHSADETSVFPKGVQWWHLAGVIALATFLVDLLIPAGVTVGIPYIVVVALAFWSQRSRAAFETAAVCTVLTISGYVLSPGSISLEAALSNRALTLFAVWAIAALTAGMVTSIREIREQRGSITRLSRELTEAEQRERERIARVLHDDLQQLLFGARLAAAVGDYDRLQALLDESSRLTRSLSHELKPPSISCTTLRKLLNEVTARSWAQHRLEVNLDTCEDFPIPDPAIRVLIHQIVGELLFNVVKHAGVRHARLVVRRDDGQVCITVEDNGSGFDTRGVGGSTAGGLGLAAARERLEVFGGRFVVDSSPGNGTRSSLMIPDRVVVGGEERPKASALTDFAGRSKGWG